MKYQTKLTKRPSQGFSILEIIIVVGIMGLLITFSTSVYNSFKSHENLEIATISVVESIRHAQGNAQSGKNDSIWGVEILPTTVIIFKGVNYASRDVAADQSLDFPGGVISSGLSEIVFTKLTGSTSSVGTITLTNSYGTKNILINEKGTLTY